MRALLRLALFVGVPDVVPAVAVGLVPAVAVSVGVMPAVGVVVGVCDGDGDGFGVGVVGTGVLLTGDPCGAGVSVGVAPGAEGDEDEDVEVVEGLGVWEDEAMVDDFGVPFDRVIGSAARRPVATSSAKMVCFPGFHALPTPSQSTMSKSPRALAVV